MSASRTLDNIKVAAPCPVSWESMRGSNRVRFCSQCQQRVHDLSRLTREEAEAVVAQPGRVCVRYFRRDDGKIMTRDCPMGLRRLRNRLALVISLFVGLSIATVGGAAWFAINERRSPGWIRTIEPFQSILNWVDPQPMVQGGL